MHAAPDAAAAPTALAFRRVALVGRYGAPVIVEPLARLAAFLGARGYDVVLDANTALHAALAGYASAPIDALGSKADVAVVIGGDGTMLAIARHLAPHGVPVIGVNQGRVGFLTDISLARMEDALGEILAGRYVEESRGLLEATVHRRDGSSAIGHALNDVVMNRGSTDSMIDCAVDIDGRFAYTLRADGIIVATSTGSTAYALSAQGPIVHPQVPAILLVPVAPHALTHRPIVINDTSTVTITLMHGRDTSAHCDWHQRFDLSEGDSIVVRRDAHSARFLHPKGHDHFAMLREKLHWSETPERLRPA